MPKQQPAKPQTAAGPSAQFKFKAEVITPEDLPLVRKLNNQHVAAVGEISANKLKYLVKAAHYAFCVKDQERVIAFYLSYSKETDYTSKNYLWHKEHAKDAFVYMDRIVVHTDY